MALKCRGEGSPLNFGVDEYGDLVPMLPQLSKARLRIRDFSCMYCLKGRAAAGVGVLPSTMSLANLKWKIVSYASFC